jgi:betaine-homocysteine S-methyltransferase
VGCGYDTIQAFTYYAHKDRLVKLAKKHLTDEINRKPLQIAKEVMIKPRNENVLLADYIFNTKLNQNYENSKKLVLECS